MASQPDSRRRSVPSFSTLDEVKRHYFSGSQKVKDAALLQIVNDVHPGGQRRRSQETSKFDF